MVRWAKMVFDFILSGIFGFFQHVFNLLPIPALPAVFDDFLTYVQPFFTKAAKMISFLFPAAYWGLLVSITKDLFIVRFAYDIYSKFRKNNTT